MRLRPAPTPPSLSFILCPPFFQFQNRNKHHQLHTRSMEKTRERKEKQPRKTTLVAANYRSYSEKVKLAAIAVALNVRLRSADMPVNMQERALRFTRSLLDSAPSGNHRPSPSLLARSLKKEFDTWYGPAWHCVVGKSFGSFVTHSPGGFVYFSLDSLSFLLFKTEVKLIAGPPPPSS